MKIGVLTYHSSINCGAVVQCYSLSKRVKAEFPDAIVEVIDYKMPVVEDFYSTSYSKLLFNKNIVGNILYLALNPQFIKQTRLREKAFKDVINVLPLSKKQIIDNGVSQLFDFINNNYDVVIAGSDAIWNYNLRGFPNPYFLSDDIAALKFSYAASCYGMSYEKLPDDQKSSIRKILDSYSLLGIRDGESENFMRMIGCKTPFLHTCDPTVFLDINDLPVDNNKIIEKIKQRGGDFSKPFVGVMGSNKMCKMVKALLGEKYQIVSLYNYCKSADVNLFDLNPYEWAYVFRFFQLTFTTYFHGTILSLRNGTPVIAMALNNAYGLNHKSKVEDFLERVELQDCYFSTDYKSINIDNIASKVDYFLKEDVRTYIINKMDLEAKTAIPFFSRVRTFVRNV